ncbi:hypothetical protein C0J52_13254 [Blattella germanica]|nr:hypothetical protein C0J52_13254 [Blattella germanica]
MVMHSLEQLAAGYALAYSYAPLILMVVSARGFVLWLFNLGAAIFMTYSVLQLKKTSQTEKESPRRLSDADVGSISYLYTSVKDDKDSYSRNNPTFQPEPLLSAWNIQSPTVGAARRGPWSFPETSSPKLENQASPTKILPRVGRPVSSPVAPLPPLPTPQPDYSPPLGRPVKHEPNLYDSPVRSVLKKPTQMGRTIL